LQNFVAFFEQDYSNPITPTG